MRSSFPLLLIALLASCAGTSRDPFAVTADAPAWPSPPEPPRIQYVTSIQQRDDLFKSDNFFSNIIGIVAGEEDTRMVRPFAVAVHPEGGLLVTDMGAGCVHFFDLPRKKYRALGRGLEGGLPSPVGVAVAVDGTILVSDSRRKAIEQFDRDGRSLGAFGAAHPLQRPGGIAVNRDTGDVFVADVLSHSIVVYAPGGDVRLVIGKNGAGPGEFNFPTHVAVDARGDLLVADSMNFRIQRLTAGGSFIAAYGEAGDATGSFARPKGVDCVEDGVYTAVEGLYDSLIFFNAAGELLISIGGAGSEPGKFWLPAGLAVDRERDLLFVADSYNSRVQVFRMLPAGVDAVETPAGQGVRP